MKKKEAIARAKDMANKGLVFDFNGKLKGKVNDETGFLTTPVKLARVGVQEYYGFELGLIERALDKIGVFRSPTEVFHVDSVESFVNLVVTDDHPDEAVTVDNVKKLQMGQVSHVEAKDEVLEGLITVTDKSLISKILSGKVEVSVGYGNDLIESKGTYDGMDYEFMQTNIVANHLAIVDAGRCGPACTLTIDHKEVPMIKITIDGIEYEVSEQVKQAHEKAVATLTKRATDAEAATEAEQEKTKAAETKADEAEVEKEKAKAKADAAEEEKVDDEEMEQKVTDKATLLIAAKSILGAGFDEATKDCGTCDTKMKAAVVGHVMKDTDLSGKPDSYIDAMFDIAVEKHGKAKKSIDALADDITKDKDGNEVTRDSLRIAHNKSLGLEVS